MENKDLEFAIKMICIANNLGSQLPVTLDCYRTLDIRERFAIAALIMTFTHYCKNDTDSKKCAQIAASEIFSLGIKAELALKYEMATQDDREFNMNELKNISNKQALNRVFKICSDMISIHKSFNALEILLMIFLDLGYTQEELTEMVRQHSMAK